MRRRRRPAIVIAAAVSLTAVAAGCSASRPEAQPLVTTDVQGGAATGLPSSSGEAADTTGASEGSLPGTSPTATEPAAQPTDAAAASTAADPADSVATSEPTRTATTFPGVAPASTLAPITDTQWAAVDAYLENRLIGNGDFAYSLAVDIDGEPTHRSAAGIRNSPDMEVPPPETEPPATGDAQTTTVATTTTTTVAGPPPEQVDVTDRFRIASISKIITGTVVLQLVADGALQLDQVVGPMLGERLGVDVAGRPAGQVTVRQLLAHTSGFGVFDNTFFRGGASSCEEAATTGLSEGLESQPGTTYRYSNMNFCLLGILIEVVTGQPYEQAVNERLLEPLGLSGLRLAGTFDPRPDEVIHPSFPGRVYMEALGPAGAWVATPAEIVAIVDSLDNTKPGFHPLPTDLAQLMRRQVPGIAYNDPYAQWYGLATIAYANQSWGHTGTVENTHTMVVHRPDGMTWALFVSGNYPDESSDLAGILQEAIDQAGIAAPAPTTSTTTTTTTTTTTLAPTTTAAGATTTSTTPS